MARDEFASAITAYETVLSKEPLGSATVFKETIAVIDSVSRACEKFGSLRERGASEAVRDAWYTRLAAALTRYISSPEVSVNLKQLHAISARKQAIAYCFAASGYRGMSHLISICSENIDGVRTLLGRKAIVLFAFLSIDDMTDELLDSALALPVEVLLPLMLGWLNTRAVLTDQGESNRTRLLTSGHLIASAQIDDSHISQVVNAWMYSSYATTPKKHEIKTHFNRLLRNLLPAGLRETAFPASGPPKAKDRKPHLLTIHERFTSVHAMYRCYAPSIQKLSERFEVTALIEEGYIDEPAKKLFERVITIPKEKKISDLVTRIRELSPDMIYYPSLGMSHWTVVLAQLRLAPIQIMTHGHPATSMSNAIDYAYVGAMEGDVSNIHSEITIIGPAAADFSPHAHLPLDLPPLAEPTDRVVRIAVNSKVMKLSSPLLNICSRLSSESRVPISFSFFPGERGLYFDGLEAAIKARVPSAEVIQYISYERFLSEICKCDFALAAFPFGNTNSTVDTALLGVPTVAHFGPEAPAQSDQYILKAVGFADWLVCRSDEEYFQTAMRLVNSPDDRKLALNGLSRSDVRNKLFGENFGAEENPFADIFSHILNHHGQLKNSGRRMFHYKELLCD